MHLTEEYKEIKMIVHMLYKFHIYVQLFPAHRKLVTSRKHKQIIYIYIYIYISFENKKNELLILEEPQQRFDGKKATHPLRHI